MRTTTRLLIRCGLTVGVATMAVVPTLAGTAYAKGKPSNVTLTCDVGASASGTVTLLSSIFGGPASNATPVSCSSGQTSKVSIHPTSQPAAAYTYNISVTNASATGGCTGNGTRGGGSVSCDPIPGVPPGATLNVT